MSYSRYQDPFDINLAWRKDFAPTVTGRSRRHFICGEAQVGKTTLRFHGLHELAQLGAYDSAHLKKLPRVARTKLPNRFEISRNQSGVLGITPVIDRWCDIDGDVLAKILDQLRDPNAKDPDVFSKLLKRSDSFALVVPARLILEAWKQEQAKQELGEFPPRIRQFIQDHMPRKNRGLKGKFPKTLVISQSARVVANDRQRSALREGVGWFAGYTGLNNLIKYAFVVDSISEEAKQFKVVPARLTKARKGKCFGIDNADAPVCSAGVVLAWLLKRLDSSALESSFVLKF
jgi:hypothetical protein